MTDKTTLREAIERLAKDFYDRGSEADRRDEPNAYARRAAWDRAAELVRALLAEHPATPAENHVPRLPDEDALWSYLDEYLNANGALPQVSGCDAQGTLFLAWLDEEGGDCVGLRVLRLLVDDGEATCTPTAVEAPAQGFTSTLTFPVLIFDPTKM